MSSPEYLRRHYGKVAEDKPKPRLSSPKNLQRRLGAANGIYEAPSKPVDTVIEQPDDISFPLLPMKVPAFEIDKWKVGSTSLSAKGTKTLYPDDALAVPEKIKNMPINVSDK